MEGFDKDLWKDVAQVDFLDNHLVKIQIKDHIFFSLEHAYSLCYKRITAGALGKQLLLCQVGGYFGRTMPGISVKLCHFKSGVILVIFY